MSIWFITGAAGFIGSNLCAYLLERGHTVKGLDNFSTGKRQNIERVQKLGGEAFQFVEGDILDDGLMARTIKGTECVMHLAAQGSVQKSFSDVAATNEINVNGFLNVLTGAASSGARSFTYATSCSVYGDTTALPISESADLRPLSPYAASKLANEYYASSLDVSYPAMRIVGLRFFNIFGPWQDPAGDYAAVIPKWIDLLMQGEPAIIFGDGNATRDFCYVGNICRLVEGLAKEKSKRGHAVYNIGTGVATRLADLYNTISSELSAKGIEVPDNSPEHLPWRTGDIVHSQSDISKAKKELGFTPGVGLKAGLGLLLESQYGL